MLVGEIVCDRAEYDLRMTVALERSIKPKEANTTKGLEVVANRMGDGRFACPSAAKQEANGRGLRVSDPMDEVIQRLLAGALETSPPRIESCLPNMGKSKQVDGCALDRDSGCRSTGSDMGSSLISSRTASLISISSTLCSVNERRRPLKASVKSAIFLSI